MFFIRCFYIKNFQCTAYPDVKLENTLAYEVEGHISYAWCRGRDYDVQAAGTVTDYRGACLLTLISGYVLKDNRRKIKATPYWSSGTGYSQFEIIETAPEKFCIQRVSTYECQNNTPLTSFSSRFLKFLTMQSVH